MADRLREMIQSSLHPIAPDRSKYHLQGNGSFGFHLHDGGAVVAETANHLVSYLIKRLTLRQGSFNLRILEMNAPIEPKKSPGVKLVFPPVPQKIIRHSSFVIHHCPMAQAIMNPEEVRRFAQELKRFNTDMQQRASSLQSRASPRWERPGRTRSTRNLRVSSHTTMKAIKKVHGDVRAAHALPAAQGAAHRGIPQPALSHGRPSPHLESRRHRVLPLRADHVFISKTRQSLETAQDAVKKTRWLVATGAAGLLVVADQAAAEKARPGAAGAHERAVVRVCGHAEHAADGGARRVPRWRRRRPSWSAPRHGRVITTARSIRTGPQAGFLSRLSSRTISLSPTPISWKSKKYSTPTTKPRPPAREFRNRELGTMNLIQTARELSEQWHATKAALARCQGAGV
jgi:hypothetical protein